jgi:hypothetical protein
MQNFELFARPFWVNFIFLAALFLLFYWRKNKLEISNKTLFYTLIFGIAFGVIEASCVIYLRASTGLLLGFEGTVFDVWKNSYQINYDQELLRRALPWSLMTYELIREVATMIMLAAIAFLVAKRLRERFAIFIWIFAVWDITYYFHLWLTIRWPTTLLSRDVLFLIPEPWYSQIWYPVFISSLMMIIIYFSRNPKKIKK